MSFVNLIKRNADGEISIASLIKNLLKEKKLQEPITEDSWIRVSSLGSICEREEVLCSKYKIDRTKIEDGDSAINFAHGHAVHWMFQNRVLPELGIFIGAWRCMYCGTQYGGRDDGYIPRPERCYRCGSVAGDRPRDDGRPDLDVSDNAFVFVEEWFGNAEYKIGGSPDGQIIQEYRPGYRIEDLTLVELKSCNENSFIKIKTAPDFVHVVQTQIYMWLTGYQRAKIIYFNKNERATKGLIEHDLDYDPECVERVLFTIKTIRDGIQTKDLPPRIVCATDDCPRAFSCKVKKYCFSE